MNRLDFEKHTVSVMIHLFCRKKHKLSDILCPDCSELHAYAMERLGRCRYGNMKPVCRRCSTHCYRPEFQEKTRAVMRFAGPRMLLRHPVLMAIHFIHAIKAVKAL
jgi:hypothetical protein